MTDELAQDLIEYKRMIPDLNIYCTHYPIWKVAFRAGLLAARESIAERMEHDGTEGDIAAAGWIRRQWWTHLLGPDPGAPRKFDYNEVAEEKPDGSIVHKDINPSVEALPYALAFLEETTPPKADNP